MNSPLSKAGSPVSRSRRQTGVSGTGQDAQRQSRVEAGMVERLFGEGKALCDAGRYDEAEEKWKQVLQVEQNDTRTLLHYAVMLRDKVDEGKKDPERAEQLLQQAMGESNLYVSIGLTSPARSSELAKHPKLRSPKKDIERWEFHRAGLRSNVEFHDLKTLRRQIQALEDSTMPQDEWGEEAECEEDLDSPLSAVEPGSGLAVGGGGDRSGNRGGGEKEEQGSDAVKGDAREA